MKPRNVPWICHACAMRSGAKNIKWHLATFHIDKCGVCKKETTVTEPRDYRWPK